MMKGGVCFSLMQILPLLQVMTNLKSLMERLFLFHHDYSILTIFSKYSLFLHVHIFAHGHSRSHLCKLHQKKEKRKKMLAYMCNCKMHYIPLFSHNYNVIAFGTRGMSRYGLAIYIKKYLNAKEEL